MAMAIGGAGAGCFPFTTGTIEAGIAADGLPTLLGIVLGGSTLIDAALFNRLNALSFVITGALLFRTFDGATVGLVAIIRLSLATLELVFEYDGFSGKELV